MGRTTASCPSAVAPPSVYDDASVGSTFAPTASVPTRPATESRGRRQLAQKGLLSRVHWPQASQTTYFVPQLSQMPRELTNAPLHLVHLIGSGSGGGTTGVGSGSFSTTRRSSMMLSALWRN